MVAAPMETLRYEDTDCGLRDDRLRCSQGGHIFYAGGSIAGVRCRRRWPRLLLLP